MDLQLFLSPCALGLLHLLEPSLNEQPQPANGDHSQDRLKESWDVSVCDIVMPAL